METNHSTVSLLPPMKRLHSLEKLIEWKRDLCEFLLAYPMLSPLAGETN